MHTPLSLRTAFLAALGGLLGPALAVHGDLLELKDGIFHAGTIVSDTDDVQLQVSKEPEAQRLSFPRSSVVRRLRGPDELTVIDAINDASVLVRLAEEYWRAGLEIMAGRCLVRAADREPGLLTKPRGGGDEALRQFWNSTLVEHRIQRGDAKSLAGCLAVARWAHDAGLSDDAVSLLRAARRIDPESAELILQARAWKVDLASRMTLDLSPGVHQRLIVAGYMDEDVNVQPRAEREFVLLPFRYQREREMVIRTGSVQVDARPGVPVRVVGFRPLIRQEGRWSPPSDASSPVFERLELALDAKGAPVVTGINRESPRSGENRPTSPPRHRLRWTGWAQAIVEVDRGARHLLVSLDGARPQEIAIDFLREAANGAADVPHMFPRLLRTIEEGDPGVAGLAVRLVSEWRRAAGREAESSDALRSSNSALLSAAVSNDPDLAAAAWRCLVDDLDLPAQSVTLAANLATARQKTLLDHIRGDFLAPVAPPRLRNVAIVFGGVIQSDDRAIAARAVDLLCGDAPPEAYEAVAFASKVAVDMAQRRANELTGHARERLLRALLARPKSIGPSGLAPLVDNDRLIVTDLEDRLLAPFRDGAAPADRAGRLAAVKGVCLSPVLYAPPLLDSLRAMFGPSATEEQRRAAFDLLIDQAALLVDQPRGSFPVRRSEIPDPIYRLLADGLVWAAPEQRRAALLAMLRFGVVFAAEESLQSSFEPGQSPALLAELARDEATIDSLGTLIARVLASADAATARALLTALDDWARPRGDAERSVANLMVRAGLNLESLADLTCHDDKALAAAALAWIQRLAHWSPQDRRQFLAVATRSQRIDRLRVASNRLSRLVDGDYNVVLVIEFVEPAPIRTPETPPAWLPPRRVTLPAGSVTFAAVGESPQFNVLREGSPIGQGAARGLNAPLLRPEDWLPSWGSTSEESRWRPMLSNFILSPSTLAPPDPQRFVDAGAARIDAGGLVRDAWLAHPATRRWEAEWRRVLTVPLVAELHYIGCGGYIGVADPPAPTSGPSATAKPDGPRLLRAVVLLDRVDDEVSDEPGAATVIDDTGASR